jgi:hypothetical protein
MNQEIPDEPPLNCNGREGMATVGYEHVHAASTV